MCIYIDFFSQKKETPVYEKYDLLLHGSSRSRSDQILSIEFMRKYIHIAKFLKPKLSEQACEVISIEYSRLRSQDSMESDVARTQPVTARTLETLIRLSTAHAKARLAKTVTVADAKAAIELVQFAYFKKVLEKEKRKRRRSGDSSDEEEETVATNDITPAAAVTPSKATRQSKRTRTHEVDDSDDEAFEAPVDAGDLTRRETRTTQSSSRKSTDTPQESEEMTVDETISDERLKVFQHRVQAAFRQRREQSMALDRLVTFVNEDVPETFSQGEISAAISRMTDANKIMCADDVVFLI